MDGSEWSLIQAFSGARKLLTNFGFHIILMTSYNITTTLHSPYKNRQYCNENSITSINTLNSCVRLLYKSTEFKRNLEIWWDVCRNFNQILSPFRRINGSQVGKIGCRILPGYRSYFYKQVRRFWKKRNLRNVLKLVVTDYVMLVVIESWYLLTCIF